MLEPSPTPNRRKSTKTELTVFKLIQERPGISRIQLAHQSKLSTAAITSIVNALAERGLLVEEENITNKVGRRRIGLRLRSELGYVVGVDLGTFNLRVAVTDLNGIPLATRSVPTEMFRGRQDVLERCFGMIREMVAEASLEMSSIKGIGVAFSGVIDVDRGLILSYPRLGLTENWHNVPLNRIMEREFSVPCVLENSVRAIALTERTQGAGTAYTDFVYVDVGMGIGSCIFVNGDIYRGGSGNAGEFGHITIDEQGPLCCCGSHGCLETLASGARLIEIVRTALEKGAFSRVLELAEYSLDKITIEIICQAAREGDSPSFRALSETGDHIGAACATLVNLLNPQAIVFGGALFRAASDLLLDQIRRIVRHRAMEKSANDVTLLSAANDGNAGAFGMARIIATEVIEPVFEDRIAASVIVER